VISGVRRCGKSILALQVAEAKKDYFYVNFDDDRLFSFTVSDFDTLLLALKELRPHQKYILILDEIQNIQGWELFVNRIKRVGYNITVTGSNANLLSRELATHLTGRHLSLNLTPFHLSSISVITKFLHCYQ
jgi:predicted AAA+ superfamily ATPase